MAIIIVEFDTEAKSLIVKKDGVVLNNVAEVSAFKMWTPEKMEMEEEEEEEEEPKFSIRVTTVESGEDMSTYTTISASEVKTDKHTALEQAMLDHFNGVL